MHPLVIKWLEALRSGEYKQGFGIGMQAEVNGDIKYCALYLFSEVIAPKEWSWEQRLEVVPAELRSNVIKWNDKERLSFLKIADNIEDFYKKKGNVNE